MIRLTPGWKPGDDDVYEEEEEEETEDEEEEEEEEETNDRASKPSSYEEIAEKKRQLFVRRNEEIQRKTALQNASSMSYSAHDLLKSMMISARLLRSAWVSSGWPSLVQNCSYLVVIHQLEVNDKVAGSFCQISGLL